MMKPDEIAAELTKAWIQMCLEHGESCPLVVWFDPHKRAIAVAEFVESSVLQPFYFSDRAFFGPVEFNAKHLLSPLWRQATTD